MLANLEKPDSPPIKSDTLKVPGATLYYEVQGEGPLLLMIPGGPTDAGVFAGLAACLADRYTVVAYDPRGNSRSTLDGAPEEQRLDVHGDDAASLITVLGDGPAHVLGNSGGAQIGLNLAARHPGWVRTLVAHEPPCVRLLPDPAAEEASVQAIYDTYRSAGVEAAMQQFMATAGMDGGPHAGPDGGCAPPEMPSEMPPEMMEAFARINGNLEYFLAHGLKPLSFYAPDVAALRVGPAKVVVGVGETTKGEVAHRTGLALAEKLGSDPVTFPGDHGGFASHAAAFADTLDRVLRGR